MGKRRRPRRKRPRHWDRGPKGPSYNWENPFPRLRPEDRISTLIDLGEITPNYEGLVAQFGKKTIDERMDYFYFFLARSSRLLEEPEFEDARVEIDPHDFLVFETAELVHRTFGKGEGLSHPDGGYTEPYEHILLHVAHRYLTEALRADLRRRARRVAQRRHDTGIGAMASAVEIGIDDEAMSPLLLGLLQKLFSDAILGAVLDHDELVQRDWQERDRSLDRWMEQIADADFDDPADQTVEALVAAGPRALPHLAHLFFDMDGSYDDYYVCTAFQAFARIPSQLSLWVLVQGLLDDDDWSSEEAVEQLAGLPDLVCPYLHYALTVPGGPAWAVALWGYDVLAKARCPRAFELLVEGLSHAGEQPHDAEVIQLSAGLGLLELGDDRAIPRLHGWLRDPQVDVGARNELLYELTMSEDGHPWADDIAGDLTLETLPVWE
jgi:hypothetical protein